MHFVYELHENEYIDCLMKKMFMLLRWDYYFQSNVLKAFPEMNPHDKNERQTPTPLTILLLDHKVQIADENPRPRQNF